GAGPIGCELAQAFARFGTQVFLVETEHGVLPREDSAAAEIVRQSLIADGIRLLCCGKDLCFEKAATGKRMTVQSHGEQVDVTVDEVLVGAGRAPNVEGLRLEHVGIACDRAGVTVNDFLQTTQPHIYAAGDICTRYRFTHVADAMAQIVLQNALFLGRAKFSSLIIPWCTYTQPEVAQVGLSVKDLIERGIEADTYEQRFDQVDRAILDDQTEGFVKVLTKRGSDRILGATIVADHAGDLISEITLAMGQNIGLGKLAKTIFPYPTQAEGIKKVATLYRKSKLTPFVKRLFIKWLAWNR
ncbi:MAG: FAD-dependent oxidoreductase, partial [Planctomycetaceae bacterium]